MKSRHTGLSMMALAGCIWLCGPAHGQTSNAPPAGHTPLQKTIGQTSQPRPVVVPSLIVFNARGASLQGQTLTLNGVAPAAIVFADRPVRAAGHDLVAHLIEDWSAGNNSFARNPPNATISVLATDGATIRDAVVVLKSPRLAADQLTFDVDVLEGDLGKADGAASLFIDIVGLTWTTVSYADWARHTAYRAAWYAAPARAMPAAVASGSPKQIGVPTARKTVDSLIVLDAHGARLAGGTLALDGVSSSAILFADRPVRATGHLRTAELVALWSSGSFAKDPPNATVSAFGKDGSAIVDMVVVLKRPRLDGDKLAFEVTALEGDLGKAEGPASLFIDTIWFGVGSGGLQYLGQNQTTGGTDPALNTWDAPSQNSGWSNPAPGGYRQPSPYYGNNGLATPPELGGGGGNYKPACGAPPLLPCY